VRELAKDRDVDVGVIAGHDHDQVVLRLGRIEVFRIAEDLRRDLQLAGLPGAEAEAVVAVGSHKESGSEADGEGHPPRFRDDLRGLQARR
jgi:hypothetical protein